MKNQKTKKPAASRKTKQARKPFPSKQTGFTMPHPVGDVRIARRPTPGGSGITVALDAEKNCVIFGFHGREEHCVYLTRAELLAVALCVEEILEGGGS